MKWRPLLLCGMASSLLYVAMNVAGPMLYPGYHVASQAVSELAAVGAPSRPFWSASGFLYDLLVLAFATGVWGAAGTSRPLRAVAALLAAFAIVGLVTPPMNPRGTEFALNDALHITGAALAVLLMLSAIALGATALGPRFRAYSVATLIVHLVFGIWTFADARALARGLPTPWIGVTERINIGAFMLWVVVLAVVLMRREERAPAGTTTGPNAPRDRDRKAPATRGVTGASGNWLLG